MKNSDLTEAERKLLETLPAPPSQSGIRAMNVWIVEWLPSGERRTGLELHNWMTERRAGWSAHIPCNSKAEVIAAIHRATIRGGKSEMVPILHLEAHGGDTGLEGPDGSGGAAFIAWEELNVPLQQLNVATKCNLIVVIAACIGIAGIQAFHQGPRAPAVALVGPDANIAARNLLWGTKEFYRRMLDIDASLQEMAASASQETGAATFEWEPFAILAYEALTEKLIKSARPHERRVRVAAIRRRLINDLGLSESDADFRLGTLPLFPRPEDLQRMWDDMFMIDLYPANRDRFGVDMNTVVATLEAGVK